MKNKKVSALLLTFVLSVSLLTACGNSSAGETESAAAEASAAEETLAETSEEETSAEESSEAESSEAVTSETETAAEEETETETAETETAEETTGRPTSLAEYTPGTWEGNVYTNEVLGIKMTFPETYYVVNGEELNGAMGDTMGEIADNADVDFDVATVYSDFMAIAPDEIGNVIMSVETNTYKLDNAGYLDALIQSFETMGVPCEVIQEAGTQTIGDTEFSMIAMALDYSDLTGVEGNTAIQAYMVHTDENLVYYFVVTFSEESLEELGEVMDSMEALQ